MDPKVLMVVAGLDHQPESKDAWIEGFELKMSKGIYPVLLPGSRSVRSRIKGKVCQAATMDQCLRLQLYETSGYEPIDCEVNIGESNSEPAKGLVFTWARDPGSSDLVEGTFDLEYVIGRKNIKGQYFTGRDQKIHNEYPGIGDQAMPFCYAGNTPTLRYAISSSTGESPPRDRTGQCQQCQVQGPAPKATRPQPQGRGYASAAFNAVPEYQSQMIR